LTKSRVTLKPKRLRKASEAVVYEVRMLGWMLQRLRNRSPFGTDVQNSLLESFLLHYRALRDFLCPCNPKSDDIVAQDFVSSPLLWPCSRENWQSAAVLEEERLNRALAHLSYSRLKYKKRGISEWDEERMAKRAGNKFRSFVKALPPSRQGWFKRAIQKLDEL
jgi:hypothetical protein